MEMVLGDQAATTTAATNGLPKLTKMRILTRVRCAALLAALAFLTLLSGCETGGDTPQSGESPPQGTATAPGAPSRAIEFVQGYSRGYQDAHAAGKPMLVFFTADWCDYCHQMLQEAFLDQRVVLLSRQFVCVLVDADREPGVCRQFEIRGFPTVQFLSPRGVPLNRVTGKTPGESLAVEMQAALQATASRLNLREAARR